MSAVQTNASSPSGASSKLVLGIRREDKNRWERRAPLAPAHVTELTKRGIKVIIQPSSLRTFSDRHYQEAGAILQDDLSEASTIIAVKEVPIELLLPHKTYMYFSHTIKAQRDNMPMLDDILRKDIRLIDYETITDMDNKRLVRFGKFAGYAGMIDTLHALGDRLLALGHSTPFLHLGYSYCYSSLATANQAVVALGEEIEHYGLPQQLVPFTFVFTAETGNVSLGAQEIFKLLPHKMVTAEELKELCEHKEKASPFMVYGVILSAKDYIAPNDPSKPFDKRDYYTNPQNYHSTFFEKYAPYSSVIVNCMYWDNRFPRIFTIDQCKQLVEAKRSRLIAVGDITCDKMGGIEFLLKTTSIDQPLFIYDPLTGETHDSSDSHDYIYRPGILFIAVDNFPTEFPKEATKYFGDNLLPFIEPLLRSDPSKPYAEMGSDLPPELHKAIVACHGKLTPRYEYIWELRKRGDKSIKHVLVLGAGFVSISCVEYLSRLPNHNISIADISLPQAKSLADGRKNCKALLLDVNNQQQLDSLVLGHDLVISLLPASFHPIVAAACLRNKKHMLTASYISPELKGMSEQVEKEGLIFLNEIGLDPGIDHLEANRVIEDVHDNGGKVRSFVSWCGGLPAPEFSGNPLGYKFSWSPRGVLLAATRDAKYLQDGRLVQIPGSTLFKHKQRVDIFPGLELEGFPNRDSTSYIEQYGLSGEARTMFRGTLRFPGFTDILEAASEIGLLDETPRPHLSPSNPDPLSWDALMRILLKTEPDVQTKSSVRHLLRAEKTFPTKGFDDDKIRRILDGFIWLELLSPTKQVSKQGNYLDCFCELLKEKLQYEHYERDMILLHHIFGIEWADGKKELRTSTLVVNGENNKNTAMAKTVGIPIAIAADLVLQGAVSKTGVIGPMGANISRQMLKALANEGIRFIERSKSVHYL